MSVFRGAGGARRAVALPIRAMDSRRVPRREKRGGGVGGDAGNGHGGLAHWRGVGRQPAADGDAREVSVPPVVLRAHVLAVGRPRRRRGGTSERDARRVRVRERGRGRRVRKRRRSGGGGEGARRGERLRRARRQRLGDGGRGGIGKSRNRQGDGTRRAEDGQREKDETKRKGGDRFEGCRRGCRRERRRGRRSRRWRRFVPPR